MNPQNSARNVAVLSLQLIHIALGMGVAVFLLVTITMQAGRDGVPAEHDPLVPPLFAAIAIVPALFIGQVQFRANLASTLPRQAFEAEAVASDEAFALFVRAITPRHLIRAAISEGVALFGLVLKFIEGRWTQNSVLYLVAPAVFLGALAVTFPTEGRLRGLFDSLRRGTMPPRKVTR